jgi:hypothetical protein
MTRLLLTLTALAIASNTFAQDVDHGGHTVHDKAINYHVLFDQFEAQLVHGEPGLRWDSRSWIGGDVYRVVVRTEGEAVDGVLDTAEAQVLFSRASGSTCGPRRRTNGRRSASRAWRRSSSTSRRPPTSGSQATSRLASKWNAIC